jgi:uncharacterized protein
MRDSVRQKMADVAAGAHGRELRLGRMPETWMSARLPDGFPRRSLIEDLAGRLARDVAVERVWLFGSRARGDNFQRSDIDLAIEAPAMSHDDWLRIKLDFADEAPTLLLIDLVRLEEVPEILREQILEEGIVIHERTRPRAAV